MDARHSVDSDILVTTLAGELNRESLDAAVQSAARAAAADGYHILVDLRDAHDGKNLSYPDVYGALVEMADYPEVEHYCIALVDRYREGFEKTQFFESAASDRGYKVRSFLDYDQAAAWLRRQESPC